MRLLVPTDGSDAAFAAVQFALRIARDRPGTEIHLLNVQLPVKGAASTFLGKDTVRQYHEEEGGAALARGEAALRDSGVTHECHIARGDPGETINAYAEQKNCDAIVMGTSGVGAVASLLGSTATAVLDRATVPVTLVKK